MYSVFIAGPYFKMLCCVLGFVILIPLTYAEQQVVLNITNSAGGPRCYFYGNVVFLDQPLKMLVYNYFRSTEAKCYTSDHNIIPFKTVKSSGNLLKLRVQKLISVSKEWTCLFYTNTGQDFSCSFPMIYQSTAISASVLINGVAINATAGVAHYSFIVGEVDLIDCTNSIGHQAQLKYYNSSGALILSTGQIYEKPVTLKLRFTNSSDNNYVNCEAVNNGDDKTKLIFHLQRSETNKFIEVNINNVRIHPQRSKSAKYNLTHIYKYRPSDNVKIQCVKIYDNNLLLKLDDYDSPHETNGSNITINLANISNTASILCSLISKENATVMENVKITFVHDNTDFYITGLPINNITEEYKIAEDHVYIRYEYTEEEDLNLFCTKHSGSNPNPTLVWILNDHIVTNKTFSSMYNSYSNMTIRLMLHHDKSTLKCAVISENSIVKQITIIFIYNSAELVNPEIEGTTVTETQYGNVEIDFKILMTVGCGTIIIIVFVGCFIYCSRIRKKNNQRGGHDENYENLTSRTDSPLPHPSQWDEPTYTEVHHSRSGRSCDADVNNLASLYSTPIPKSHRVKKRPVEGHYANEDKTYELVDDMKNQVTYAEVTFDNRVGTNRPVPKREDALYSEVTQLKGTSTDNKYGNVFDNSGYVNTHTDCEYAEPAYCELNNR